MKRSFWLVSIAVLVFSTLLFYHCSKITGDRPANVPPEISFANVPPDSTTVSFKPTVYWFGKDIDGYVAEYQYVVVKLSQLGALGLNADGFVNILKNLGGFNWVASCSLWADSLEVLGEEGIEGIALVTERGRGQTSAQVQLFASPDSVVFVQQYIFLRAVDNLGASSIVLYRLFSRNNHAPNTKIEGFNTTEVHYSLPETTATWKGIKIDWTGSDSSDYPRVQPEFEYHIELYGPFPSKASIDTINPDPNKLLADTAWVPWKTVILPKGIDPSLATLETGWYLFRTRARDDALIPDPTPSTAVFLVIRPACNKNILAVDVTYYSPAPFGYELDSVKVRNFYQTIFANAGVPINNSDFLFIRLRESPPESLLSQYKMILLINHDLLNNTPNETTFSQLIKYLSVGGKLWLMGMNNFNVRSGFAQRRDLKSLYELNAKLSFLMGFNFCGVKEVYYADWTSLGDSGNCPPLSPSCQALPKDTAWYRQRNEEFIGADPLLAGWPSIETDTLKVKGLTTKKSGVSLIFYDKLPGVDYNTVGGVSNAGEALYLFNSYKRNASPSHGKPCALRYAGPAFQATYPDVNLRGKPIFRTAEFTFPLYYMNESQATTATGLMLQWFNLTECNFPQ